MGNFFKRLNQRGVIQFIPLLLILAGIVASVYLVQKSGYQIFKPKATGTNIQFIDHSQSSTSCVTIKDNKQVTTCPTIQFKLTSPLENQNSSDAGFQLIKTAYASHPPDTEDYYCANDNTEVWHSERYSGFICDWWIIGGLACQGPLKHSLVMTCPRTTICKDFATQKDSRLNRNASCVSINPSQGAPEIKPSPQGPAPECSNDTACDDKNPCTVDYCLGKGTLGSLCINNKVDAGTSCGDGKVCNDSGECSLDQAATETPEPTAPPVATPRPTARPSPSVVPTAAPSVLPTVSPSQQVPPQGSRPTVSQCISGPAGTVTAAQADCVLKLRPDIVPFFKQNNWCTNVIDYPGIVNNWMGINNQADKDQVKGCFGGGTTTRVTKKYKVAEDSSELNSAPWQDYTSGMTVSYTFKNTNPGLKYIYVQFQDDQGNTINTTPITAQIELVSVSVPAEPTISAKASCDGKTSIITWSWTIPSTGVDTFNVILPGNSSTNNPASSSFKEYVQRSATAGQTNTGRIEVVNSAGKNSANASVTALDCSTGLPSPSPSPTPTPTPTLRPEGSAIPAGSECSAYITTSICGGGFKTYDKCTDDKGQTGSQLCSGGAVQFYCEGSTNSNCLSSRTRTPHYYCSACPNLSSR